MDAHLQVLDHIACEINLLKTSAWLSTIHPEEKSSSASITLGSEEDAQRGETLWSTDLKDRFMLHYNFLLSV